MEVVTAAADRGAYTLGSKYASEESVLGNELSITHVLSLLISGVGLAGNVLAVAVLRRSRNIRVQLSSPLLVSQSVADGATCLLSVVMVVSARYTTDVGYDPNSVADRLFCWFWLSDFWLYATMTISATNLAALSLERAISVASPIFHRTYVTATTVVYLVSA